MQIAQPGMYNVTYSPPRIGVHDKAIFELRSASTSGLWRTLRGSTCLQKSGAGRIAQGLHPCSRIRGARARLLKWRVSCLLVGHRPSNR